MLKIVSHLSPVVMAVLLLLSTMASASHASLIQTMKFNSKFLKREYVASVYLPYRYKSSGLNYPVLYLLHGPIGDENSWLSDGHIRRTVDALIANGKIPPCIVIMPSHFNAWWVDGNRESSETVFFKELIPTVDQEYRTINNRSGRAVGGVSAGGYGTVLYVFKHPEMFAAAAALSPAIYTPLPPQNSSAYRSHPFIDANRQFEEETWKRLNYPNFIYTYFRKGIKVPIYINSGDDDKFDVTYHAAVLYKRLRDYQPDLVEFRVVDGDHDWNVWSETAAEAITYIMQFVSKPLPKDQPVEAGN